MKQVCFFLLLIISFEGFAQKKPFRFAFISDTHIGSPSGGAEEDLRRTVADINNLRDIDFVVLTGDITELGTNAQLVLAKKILDSLNIPYYIIPGNHDTGWSESGGLGFTKTFGDDKFYFKHKGVHFIGCASGPYVRMSDGHVPRHAVNWLQSTLKKIGKKEPIVFLNHYPLDNGLDNWYEIIDMLKTKNTVLALCGHGHNNRPVKAEDIPAIMGRSNLRAKDHEGGYNLVDVNKDSFLFTVRKPVSGSEKKWNAVANKLQEYPINTTFPRPDFSVNKNFPQVKAAWTYQSPANVISTPAVIDNELVVFGNQNGEIEALDYNTGKKRWTFKTGGPIFSSPAVIGQDIVVGSADGYVYYINSNGRLIWKFKTDAAVLGSPLIYDGKVYIGGSDHHFRAISLESGQLLLDIPGIGGPIVSKPVVYGDILLFGAWDTHLYAYNLQHRKMLWKWNNGSRVINFSPAACVPVVKDSVVYIAAPDRFLTAIDLVTGQTLWRTKEAAVRESIGISEDGKFVYGKTMQDTLVAFKTNREKPQLAWKMNVGYGYEHTPSVLIEKQGKLFFGTKNGVVYAVNPSTQKLNWAYKIDNSMVNTMNVVDSNSIIASTMDGKVCLLQTN